MPVRISIDAVGDMAEALDRMVADMELGFPRELAAAAAGKGHALG